MLGLTFGGLLIYFVEDRRYYSYLQSQDLGYGQGYTEYFTIPAALLVFIAIIFYTIVLKVKSCTCCCCCCACKCGPFVKRSGLDIETLEVVDLEEVQNDLATQLEI